MKVVRGVGSSSAQKGIGEEDGAGSLRVRIKGGWATPAGDETRIFRQGLEAVCPQSLRRAMGRTMEEDEEQVDWGDSGDEA